MEDFFAWLTAISAILALLILIQYLALWCGARFIFKNHSAGIGELPKVAVLVSARNEETHLPALLASLEKLEYPSNLIEFFIADDQSKDRTAEILSLWAIKGENRFMLNTEVLDNSDQLENGKARALAMLEKETNAEILFFTDADCVVPPSWIQEGVKCMSSEVGLMNGITQVSSGDLFSKMQEIDWWHTLGMVKIVSDLNLPATGLGNNMVIRKTALEAVGGFAGVLHSLTEDLEILKKIRAAGYSCIHQVSPEILVKTKAEASWGDLLEQRKRWMSGVITLPLFWLVLLSLQILFYPAVILILILNPLLGIGIWLVKIFLQALFIKCIAHKVKQTVRWESLLIFDFYHFLSTSHTILYYFWPSRIKWKSRSYP